MTETINLLERLGVSNKRWLKKSPALTLHSDGTLEVWERWSHFLENYATERYDLSQIQKVRYLEELHHHVCGIDLSIHVSSVNFYRAIHKDTAPLFSIDPLWLAVPQVQQFLTQHLPEGIRNDFAPARNWSLKRRYDPTPLFPAHRSLKNTTRVLSEYGSITWEVVGDTALVRVFGSERGWSQKPLDWLLTDGVLTFLPRARRAGAH